MIKISNTDANEILGVLFSARLYGDLTFEQSAAAHRLVRELEKNDRTNYIGRKHVRQRIGKQTRKAWFELKALLNKSFEGWKPARGFYYNDNFNTHRRVRVTRAFAEWYDAALVGDQPNAMQFIKGMTEIERKHAVIIRVDQIKPQSAHNGMYPDYCIRIYPNR